MAKCRTIAIFDQKGGVGKTTTALDLGVGLASQGKRMLLVTAICRETALQSYLDTAGNSCDFIIIDCMPSLGMIKIKYASDIDFLF